VTNGPPVFANSNGNWNLPTNLPSLDWKTNNDVLWTATNSDFAGIIPTLKDMGQLLYNADVTIERQAHSDAQDSSSQAHTDAATAQSQGTANANGIIAAINDFHQDNHRDLNSLNANAASAAGLAHVDAKAINDAIAGIHFTNNINVGVSNYVYNTNSTQVSVTNLNYFSNYSASISNYNLESTQTGVLSAAQGALSTLAGMSNLLAKMTNGTDGSGSNYGHYAIDSAATNSDAAVSAAATWEDYTGIGAFVDMCNPVLPPDTAGSPNMSMSFLGQTINLDPIARFSGVATVCYQGFKIAALLAFFTAVGRLYWSLLQVKASAQTGGVPDMQIELWGFGGNGIGWIVGRAVSVAFIVLFAAASAYIFAHLGASVADAMDATVFTNALSSTAIYLLTSLFAVRLIFSLAMTLIVLQFTLGKIVNVAIGATRFLVGR